MAIKLSNMNNSGVLPQEKMELDLEIPSSLVQSDGGHLRRSNSAPMINGLRLYTYNNARCNLMFNCADA